MGKLKILSASAGSGKTFSLAYEYVRNVVKEPYRYRNILAVTFTNKATAEMKSRILKELNELTKENCSNKYFEMLVAEGISPQKIKENATKALKMILHDYSNFSVMTIDGFFQKIIRSFVKELHLESDYTIDFNTDYLLKLSIDKLISDASNDTVLKSWIDSFIEDNILASKGFNLQKEMHKLSFNVLSENFNRAYFEKNQELLMEFFASLGEKREKIAEGIEKIARNFIALCEKWELGVEDLPGKSRGVLPYVKKAAEGNITQAGSTIRKDARWQKKGSAITAQQESELKPILELLIFEIDKSLKDFNSIDAILVSHRTFVLLSDISKYLYEVCNNNNKMLLSNTNYLINRLIKGNDAPYIYEKIGNHYSVIMIDEFQDTSSSQWENFTPLIENALSESEPEQEVTTLVGDVKQSIYRWRGGDWRILSSGIEEVIGEERVEKYTLDTNYRSEREVVEFNNAIVRGCVAHINNYLNTLIVEYRSTDMISVEFAAQRLNMLDKAYYDGAQKTIKNSGGGYVEVIKYPKAEGGEVGLNLFQVVSTIKDLQDRGYEAKEIAILVRNKVEAKEIVNHIIEYKKNNAQDAKNYCFDIISEDGLSLNRSSVVKFVISVYSLIISNDTITRAVYNRYLGRDLRAELDDMERDFLNSLLYTPAIESFEQIVSYYSLGEHPNNMAYLQALHNAIIDFCGTETASVASLLEWWDSSSENLKVTLPEGQNAITITTVHKSKGLEYKSVILPFCRWSLSPKVNSNIWAISSNSDYVLPETDEQKIIINYSKQLENSYFADTYLDETILTTVDNFNIFYVALTRAVKELYIMIPEKSNVHTMSSYICEVLPDMDDIREESSGGCVKYMFGEKKLHQSNDSKELDSFMRIENFKQENYHNRLKLHLESDKYFKEPAEDENGDKDSSKDNEPIKNSINARGKGILLHKLFEQLGSLEELDQKIDIMLAGGYLTRRDSDKLKSIAAKALENPVIKDWFSGNWQVKSESSIILPNEKKEMNILATLRPDRVLINGNEAVVIDYKFGMESGSHRKQIVRYMELLSTMGYSKVKGFLWYINIDKIELVET